MARITLIDKDRTQLAALKDMLVEEGFRVDSHTDPVRALQSMRQRPTDLAVMDMKMPRIDGISMLEKLKMDGDLDVPIVFLSGDDDQMTEVMALRMGAEDYVHKPYSPRVLLERLRNCLRRAETVRKAAEGGKEAGPIVRGALEIDPNTMRVLWKKQPVVLTSTEFELLYYLAETPDYVRSRQQVMDRIYGTDIFLEERVVDSHLKRLRKKIREVDPEFSAIETIYGAGYRFLAART